MSGIMLLPVNDYPKGAPAKDYSFVATCKSVEAYPDGEKYDVMLCDIEANAFDNTEIASKISLSTFFAAFGETAIQDYLDTIRVNKLLK